MQLRKLSGRGFKPFIEDFELDLEALNGKLVAVTGFNGAGKSTLLNLFPACLFRKFPKRGNLVNVAEGRHAYIECEIEYGQTYTIRQIVDAFSGKAETSLTNGDGKAILASGKVSEYQKWADEHLLPPQVFFGSVFSSQGTTGFLGLDPAQRKDVVLKVLGLDRFNALSEAAREQKRGVDKELAAARARLDELGNLDIDKLTGERDEAAIQVKLDEKALLNVESTLAAAKDMAKVVEEQRIAYDKVYGEVVRLDLLQKKLARGIEDNQSRIAALQGTLDKKDAIEAAVKRHSEVMEELERLNKVERDSAIRLAEMDGEDRELAQQEKALTEGKTTAERVLARANQILARQQEIMDAVESLAAIEDAFREAETDLQSAQREINTIQEDAQRASDGRITGLRHGLNNIVEGASNPTGVASQTLKNDDRAVQTVADWPEKLAFAKDEVARHLRERVKIQADLDKVRETASHLKEIETAESAKSESEEMLAALNAQQPPIQESRIKLDQSRSDAQVALTTLKTEKNALTGDLAQIKTLSAKEPELREAETRIKGYQEQITAIETEKAAIVIPELPDTPPPAIELRFFEGDVRSANSILNEDRLTLQLAERSLKDAQEKVERQVSLTGQCQNLEAEVADWKRLGDDLGKDGIQALLIDAAAPELTTLANDLLRASGDGRFQLSITTTKMDSTGKRELEGFIISIYDSRDGSTKEGASGGEEVFLNTSLSQALTTMACRHMGLSKPTLIFDETGSALDSEYGPAWINMLRRTSEIVDASHVLYVSHDAALWEMADARIMISNGKISVE